MEKEHAAVDRHKRKALLYLPLLILPFLTMGFWALGGGKQAEKNNPGERTGLNPKLPSPHLQREEGNKLSFYEVARQDSQKKMDYSLRNTYYQQPGPDTAAVASEAGVPVSLYHAARLPEGSDPASSEEKVYRQLSELNRQLSQPLPEKKEAAPDALQGRRELLQDGEADRLDNMLRRLSPQKDKDPELEQLSGMMEKILDIQHPERVTRRLQATPSTGGQVLAVHAHPSPASVSCLDTAGSFPSGNKGFYPVATSEEQEEEGSLPAVIHAGGEVVEGSVVKFRLLTDAWIHGVLIPRQHLVYGVASMDRERVQVHITSIRYRDLLLPVRLEVCDMDGLPGLAVPGVLAWETAKNALGSASQTIGLTMLDPSIKSQVAGAGVSAVKSLLSKKARRQSVHLKAGYRVLLRDTSKG